MDKSAASGDRPPRYKQLAEELIAEIKAGRPRVGTTIPGELELMERFKVSRHTVREALRLLDDLGLIERRRGVGTVVRSRQSNESYVQTVRTPAELMRYPADSRLQVVGVKDVRASRRLAQLIGCATGTRWCQISAVRRFKGARLPLCWVDIYVLPEYAEVAELIGRRPQPVYEIIEQRFGEKVSNVRVDLRGGRIAPEIAGALAVEPDTASLTVVRRYLGNNNRMFEASVSEHPADRYTYSLELRRGWQAGDAWAAS
jgi:GntR family transcriptional regulator